MGLFLSDQTIGDDILTSLRRGDDVYLWQERMRPSEANRPFIWPWNSYSIRPYWDPARKDGTNIAQVTSINVAADFGPRIV